MTATVTIRVFDLTGCPFAVSAADGQPIDDRIAPPLLAGTPVAAMLGRVIHNARACCATPGAFDKAWETEGVSHV